MSHQPPIAVIAAVAAKSGEQSYYAGGVDLIYSVVIPVGDVQVSI
jgi:hypothetical protein